MKRKITRLKVKKWKKNIATERERDIERERERERHKEREREREKERERQRERDRERERERERQRERERETKREREKEREREEEERGMRDKGIRERGMREKETGEREENEMNNWKSERKWLLDVYWKNLRPVKFQKKLIGRRWGISIRGKRNGSTHVLMMFVPSAKYFKQRSLFFSLFHL